MREKYSGSIHRLTHQDFVLLRTHETVQDALDRFRNDGLPHKIIYLYVVDENQKLLGVLPLRRLLAAQPDTRINHIFLKKIVALPEDTTVEQAKKAFAAHKFLAFPIVNKDGHVLSVLDIEKFAGDIGDVSARTDFEDIYAMFGVDPELEFKGSALDKFRSRFPWLLATIASGTLAAILVSQFEVTLQKALVLAFFMTMVLGLNESVSMQSMAATIHSLHKIRPSLQTYKVALRKELGSGIFLGLGCGLTAGGVAFAWRWDPVSAFSIGLSLVLSIALSCAWGISVPYGLHALQKDPKVAASPLVLALTDLSTLFLYFLSAHLIVE